MTTSDLTLLRFYINDPSGSDQMFSAGDLQTILDQQDGDLHAAAAELWSMKAATVSEWYLSQTDGALLDREKVFQHCMAMVRFHKTFATLVSVELSTGNDEDTSSEF